jgi:PAS domain S-box-containing protein
MRFPKNGQRLSLVGKKTKTMKVSSHRMLRVQAVIAGWLFVFFLVRTIAADLALDTSLPAAIEPVPAQVQDTVPAEQEAAIPTFPEFSTSEGVATTLAPSTNVAALPQVTPELNNDVKSGKSGMLPHLRPDFATLMLFACLFLMVGIAYTVRKLNSVNRQLNQANSRLNAVNRQLERQAQDLSSSNELLKKEVGERRHTEEALRDSENSYSSLVESVPQNIFRKDLTGKYTFANRAFCATLGKTAGEILGKTDQELLPADLASRLRREDEQVLSSGEQLETKQNYPTADGGRNYVLMVRTTLLDSDRQPIGIQGIFWDLSERQRAERELVSAHRQLVAASRRVGMAEVATGVLHNVGNVLNSVNVSATLVCEHVKKSKVLAVSKVAALLCEHADDQKYLIEDERGKQLPGYLKDLGEHLRKEQASVLNELDSLVKNIEHIKEIVVMQQDYAKLSGLSVAVKTSEMVEDALRMNSSALTRHEVNLAREFIDNPTIIVDKHTVLQILVNLIRNAKYACDESGRSDKLVTDRIFKNGTDGINVQITDNGVGIPRENLGRLFSRGFTTRSNGHGFGLHSCLLAAKEMGGALSAHSDGPGLGAVFTLVLPLQPPQVSA